MVTVGSFRQEGEGVEAQILNAVLYGIGGGATATLLILGWQRVVKTYAVPGSDGGEVPGDG